MNESNPFARMFITEAVEGSGVFIHALRRMVVDRMTEFQHLVIADTEDLGRCLFLDGVLQASVYDEFVYHETLVHPASVLHRAPRTVLVLGGGDGGTLREVLRWRTVRQVTLVELDREVLDAAKAFLGELHGGAFDDPRVEVVIGDGAAFLDRNDGPWDLVLADLTDPVSENGAASLYTRAFYSSIRARLAPGGIFATHAGAVGPGAAGTRAFAAAASALSRVFEHILPCCVPVPSYGCMLGFLLAASVPLPWDQPAEAVDHLLHEHVAGELRSLDGMALGGLFRPPRYIRRALARRPAGEAPTGRGTAEHG
ncbi:MAG TPA: hypothetical protein VFS20_04525 [Longimicrobium sp.]|nr:hypothetical protein [Longimicrobium sp.]